MKIWFDGKILDHENVRIPIDTHALHYGTSVFEGIRSYKTVDGRIAVFRLEDHIDRLYFSANVLGIKPKFKKKEIINAICEVLIENKLEDAYIRPIIFYGSGSIGLDVSDRDHHIAIFAIPMSKYLKEVVRCTIVSFKRPNYYITVPSAKIGGIYVNSVLATMEAKRKGYDEAIMLDLNGNLAEGPGENLFLYFEESGEVFTPPPGSILPGITRDTLIKVLPENFDVKVAERVVNIKDLKEATEVFFCGTAAEVTPIEEVDGKKYSTNFGRKVRELYLKIVRGSIEDYMHWLYYIE